MKAIRRVPLRVALTIASVTAVGVAAPVAVAASAFPVPPNLGTAEGTAALIQNVPKLGAGPFALGMPADEAVARMKADGMFNGGVGVRPSIGFKFSQLPDHPLVGGSYGARKLPDGSGENVGLLFTMYPSKPVVAGVSRGLSFTPETAPSVGNTVAELRKKYGPESGTGTNLLYWVFDYQGHPLSKAQMAELEKNSCLSHGSAAGGRAGGIVDTDWMGGKIERGYVEYLARIHSNPDPKSERSANPACLSTVRVDADFEMREPGGTQGAWGSKSLFPEKAADWARAANAVVESLGVTVLDIPLDYSASTVSRNAVLSGGAAEQQRQRDAAGTRKPSL
ncbi:MAG: hypothetical protein LC137_01235 [Burkholderiales bacterium]|nr:hypothetical protein [Burkholderiales bacterium]